MDLILNHSVKIKDIGLLQYFYPNFIILNNESAEKIKEQIRKIFIKLQ